MTVEQHIQSRLLGSPDLLALVPASRIRMPGEHVQLADPYVIHGGNREQGETLLSGSVAALRRYDYTVAAFHRTLAGAKEIAEIAREAVGGHQNGCICILDGSAIGYDAEARLYSITLNLRVFLAE